MTVASSVAGNRADEIALAAREILEEEGPDALTMRRLADRLGVRAPSLYKHVAGKETLQAAVIASGLDELGEALSAAARTADEPLVAIAAEYRRFALAHPHLYRLMTEQPLPRHLLPPGLEARTAAPLIAATGDLDSARATWAFAHGMCQLELVGRFPPDADIDAAWRTGLAALSGHQPAQPRAVIRSWKGPD
jgi:AcrR family transcriptional regulator